MNENNYLKKLNKLDPDVSNIKITNSKITGILDMSRFSLLRNLEHCAF
jgi:hypothetical protein